MKSTLTLVYANICINCIRLWFYLTLPKVIGVCAREVYLQNYQCTYNYDDNDWLVCAFALLRVVNWWSTDCATNTTIYALNQTQSTICVVVAYCSITCFTHTTQVLIVRGCGTLYVSNLIVIDRSAQINMQICTGNKCLRSLQCAEKKIAFCAL